MGHVNAENEVAQNFDSCHLSLPKRVVVFKAAVFLLGICPTAVIGFRWFLLLADKVF